MIPDGFQYFLDDFWNFQYFHQTCTLTPLFLCRNASNNTKKYGNILKNIIFISHHFKIPIFPKKRHYRTSKMWNCVFNWFFIWWVQNIWFLRAFSKICRWWNLDEFWKSEHHTKNLQTYVNPIESKISLRKCRYFLTNVDGRGNLVFLDDQFF